MWFLFHSSVELTYVDSIWIILAIRNILQREYHQGMWGWSWNRKIHINKVKCQTFFLRTSCSIIVIFLCFWVKCVTNIIINKLVLLLLERFLIWILKALDTKGMFSSAMTSNFLLILFLIMKVLTKTFDVVLILYIHIDTNLNPLQTYSPFFFRWWGW